jgi:hypothetical protein
MNRAANCMMRGPEVAVGVPKALGPVTKGIKHCGTPSPQDLRDGLNAMSGDNPPSGGGPAPNSNTYSYLKAHVAGGAAAGLTDEQFRRQLTSYFGLAPDGLLNIEGLQLTPLLVEDDDFYFELLGAEVFPGSSLIADPTPPFMLYPANFNQVQASGNPFSSQNYRDRYFAFCSR